MFCFHMFSGCFRKEDNSGPCAPLLLETKLLARVLKSTLSIVFVSLKFGECGKLLNIHQFILI